MYLQPHAQQLLDLIMISPPPRQHLFVCQINNFWRRCCCLALRTYVAHTTFTIPAALLLASHRSSSDTKAFFLSLNNPAIVSKSEDKVTVMAVDDVSTFSAGSSLPFLDYIEGSASSFCVFVLWLGGDRKGIVDWPARAFV